MKFVKWFVGVAATALILRLAFMLYSPVSVAQEAKPQSQPVKKTEVQKVTMPEVDCQEVYHEKVDLVGKLEYERKRIEKRKSAIVLRENVASIAEKKLDRRSKKLISFEKKLKKQMQIYKKEKAKDIQSIVSVYENMEPLSAARVLNSLSPEDLVGIVRYIDSRAMGEIFANMDPEKVRKVTLIIAK